MKKVIRTIAFIVALNLTMVSCQKEQIVNQQSTIAEINTMYTVWYAVDGVPHNVTLSGEQAWQDFLEWMVALSEEGHRVSFRNESVYGKIICAKERVVFTTMSSTDAVVWARYMTDQGYVVSVEYNQNTGVYTCVAVR